MRFLPVLKTRKGKPINFAALDSRIEKLCTKYNIDLFYVFGSYAGGNTTALSDLDLAYYSKKKVAESSLLGELQDLFEEEAIDLVDIRNASLPLRHRIFKGKCLYASSIQVKIEIETRAEAEYFDTAPLREEYFEKMRERINCGAFGTG